MAFVCADMLMPWGGPDTPLADRPAALARAVARLTTAQVWPFDRATAAGNGFIQTCLNWPPSPAPSPPDLDQQVAAVRGFNRFYTRKLGVLDQHLLDSPFSLSEARVIYELAHRDDAAAKEIGIELGLDAGYLSRIVQSFDEDGLITRKPLPADRRQHQLSLTAKGRRTFAKLDRTSHDEVAAMLGQLGHGSGVGEPPLDEAPACRVVLTP